MKSNVTGDLPTLNLVDLAHCTIIPPLVDCHVHLCLSGGRDPVLRQAQVDMPFDRARITIRRHLVDDLAHGITAVRDAGDYAGHALGFKHGPLKAEALPVVMRCAGRAWHARGRYGRLLGRAPFMGESLKDALERTQEDIDQLKVIHSGINSLSSFGRVKNRFGSTNEIGVFEMKDKGLDEVANPSAVFLSEQPAAAAGSVVAASMEGTRPILVELQALTCGTSFGTPRRTILGLDANRVALLAAVMEKKVGMHLMGYDIFMNVAGGVKVVEPAVDLAIVAAIASSFPDKPVPDRTVVIGEVGLTGEVRAIGQAEQRILEARKMGFDRCILPQSNLKRLPEVEGIQIAGVRSVSETAETLF